MIFVGLASKIRMFLKSTSFVQKTCTLIANLATVLSVVPMINSFQKVTVLVGHHSTFTPGVNAAWLNVVGHTHLSNSSRSTRDATLPHTHPWLRKNIPVCFNKNRHYYIIHDTRLFSQNMSLHTSI